MILKISFNPDDSVKKNNIQMGMICLHGLRREYINLVSFAI